MISLTNPYVLLGGVCGAALLAAVSFGLGHHQKTLEDRSAALSGAQKAIVTVSRQGAVTSAVAQRTAQATAKTQQTTSTNLQTVRLYVPPIADSKCIVGTGAVRLLDAAARDTVPDPALGLPDADSGVALSELVSDAVVNAGAYHQLAERLSAWDDWYDGQAKIAAGR